MSNRLTSTVYTKIPYLRPTILWRVCLCLSICVLLVPMYWIFIQSNQIHRHSAQSPCAKLPNSTVFEWPRKYAHSNVPKLVHYVYADDFVPVQYEALITHCILLNEEDVHFILWTDNDVERHLRPLLPPRYRHLLDSYTGIKKADVIRLLLILYIGGVYMDMDMQCMQPFSAFMREHGGASFGCLFDTEVPIQTQILYNREFAVMNNLIISPPRHPFVAYLLDNMQLEDNKTSVMNATGPLYLTRVYEDYQNLPVASSPEGSVMIATSNWFSPLVDSIYYLEKLCLDVAKVVSPWAKYGCSKIPDYQQKHESLYNNAYLVHRFLHLGYIEAKSHLTQFIHACNFPSLYRLIV